MIYVNQSWEKKKKSSLQCWIVYSSSLPKKCGIQMTHTSHPSGKKKVHKPSATEKKFRDTDAVHGIHAPLSPPQKYD